MDKFLNMLLTSAASYLEKHPELLEQLAESAVKLLVAEIQKGLDAAQKKLSEAK